MQRPRKYVKGNTKISMDLGLLYEPMAAIAKNLDIPLSALNRLILYQYLHQRERILLEPPDDDLMASLAADGKRKAGAISGTDRCGSSSVQRVGTAVYARLAAGVGVSVYNAEDQIKQPFEVVGIVSYENPGKYVITDLGNAMGRLKEEARSIGGNGIIIDKAHPVQFGIISTGLYVEARAIRIRLLRTGRNNNRIGLNPLKPPSSNENNFTFVRPSDQPSNPPVASEPICGEVDAWLTILRPASRFTFERSARPRC